MTRLSLLGTLTAVLGMATTYAAAAATGNTFEIVGESGVSAQQMFLGNKGDKVYIVDKTEKNPASINGHPAWGVEYDVAKNTYQPMDIISNSFW